MFEQIPQVGINLVFFIAACFLLIMAGSWLVKTITTIASFLRLSEFVIGFIVMAFCTSLPELFVGIQSALNQTPALILGTVIGSNIADLTIVGGVAVLLAKGIKIKSHVTTKDSYYMFMFLIIPIVLMFIGKELSRIDGAILIGIFLFYSWRLVKQREKFSKQVKNKINKWKVLSSVVLFLASLALLYWSADLVVEFGTKLAMDFMVPIIFIGIFFVAVGTSLPELVFETKAAMSSHGELAIGDLIGSVVANSSLVLGISALIFPITAEFFLFFTSALFMIVIAFLFVTFLTSGRRLMWKEGIAMIMLYILFLVVELNLNNIL